MKARLRRCWQQLPNLVTFTNLLCGVAAIMLATSGYLLAGAAAIFIAGALDVLDGALARRMRGGDPFGEALDSLADIISFGVAPALLVYEGFLRPWPVLGWIIAGGYVVCGAWRLARFAAGEKGPFFQGLPITMGGMTAASLLFYPAFWSPRVAALVLLVLAVLMVSYLRFPKVPVLLRPVPRPARAGAMPLLALAPIAFSPQGVIVALGGAYFLIALLDNLGVWGAVAHGPVGDAFDRLRERF